MKKPTYDELVQCLKDFADYTDRQICTHETHHEAGAIWYVCDNCGARWMRDEPVPVTRVSILDIARDLLNRAEAVGDDLSLKYWKSRNGNYYRRDGDTTMVRTPSDAIWNSNWEPSPCTWQELEEDPEFFTETTADVAEPK